MKNEGLRIGVCHEQGHKHELMEKLVNMYEKEAKEICDVIHFFSEEEVIPYEENLDVLVVWAELFQRSSMEIVRKIKHNDCKVVLVNDTDECFKGVFEMSIFRFLIEPFEKEEFFNVIDDVKREILGMEKVSVSQNSILYQITQRNICYIEAYKPGVYIYTKNERFYSNMSLGKWLAQLNKELFFQCHRSCIINLDMVDKIKDDIVWLKSGKKVKVARRRKKEMLSRFLENRKNQPLRKKIDR